MKKNGKKYRKLQKNKELKRQTSLTSCIDDEVDGIKTINLAMAQIVIKNPIIKDVENIRKKYIDYLIKYLKLGGWDKRKYESSGLEAYKKILLDNKEIEQGHPIDFYQYYILFDVLHILGYPTKKIQISKINNLRKQHAADFINADPAIVKKIINSVQGEDIRLTNLKNIKALSNEYHYIDIVRKNILFRKHNPFVIMVTATMSAGKSTFINSIIGKYVCLSQNMACTSKIHSIINKAYEDGYSTEYDHDLIMTAEKEELLNDNKENLSNVIYVATNFIGKLNNSRIIVNDSPGVNFSGDQEHQKIANQLIKRRKYGLLIYVMNATQLGTNDEDKHLDFVKQTIGRRRIIFVVNKVDSFDPDEENIEEIISRQTTYLKGKGFENPIVCPVSSRAGYLSKKSQLGTLTRSEERELYNFVDKFDKLKLDHYYYKEFPNIEVEDNHKEEVQLQKTCGLLFIEELIKQYAQGGKKDGTNLFKI